MREIRERWSPAAACCGNCGRNADPAQLTEVPEDAAAPNSRRWCSHCAAAWLWLATEGVRDDIRRRLLIGQDVPPEDVASLLGMLETLDAAHGVTPAAHRTVGPDRAAVALYGFTPAWADRGERRRISSRRPGRRRR